MGSWLRRVLIPRTTGILGRGPDILLLDDPVTLGCLREVSDVGILSYYVVPQFKKFVLTWFRW